VVDRRDPVLGLLPDHDDMPKVFRMIRSDEHAWRGRLFLIYWLLYRNEGYAWSSALSSGVPDDARQAVSEVSDQQILADLELCPLPR
jgi:hypothetical protein